MVNCPRCGAANRPGRSSCWNCFAPLPPAVTPATADPPSTHAPVKESRAVPTRNVEAPASQSFVFVAAPTVDAEKQGTHWLLITAIILSLLLLGSMLLWLNMAQPHSQHSNADYVAGAYLAALRVGDTGAQQQLANDTSKGQAIPHWFTIYQGQLENTIHIQGDQAETTVSLYLAPTPRESGMSDAVIDALSRPYRITLSLRLEHGGWHVDQQALFQRLRRQLAKENPELTFPKW